MMDIIDSNSKLSFKEREKIRKAQYYELHKEDIKSKSNLYYIQHKNDEDFIKTRKLYRDQHVNVRKIYNSQWYKDHKEKQDIKSKKYREEHKNDEVYKEKQHLRDKRYREEHKNDEVYKEKQRIKNKNYRNSHPEYFKQWELDHKDEMNEIKKQWRIDNKDRFLKLQKLYRDEHKEEEKIKRETIRMEVIDHYTNGELKCKCGENHLEFLEIDHIDGNGKKHKRDNKIGSIYYWLYTNGFPDGYQVLCSNCNWKKLILQRGENTVKTSKQIAQQKYNNNLKLDVFSHYMTDGKIKCSCPGCDVDDIDVLTIDHKDNDGCNHRKKVGNNGIYRDIKKQGYPDNYRILCRDCNQSLKNYGYCPHNETV